MTTLSRLLKILNTSNLHNMTSIMFSFKIINGSIRGVTGLASSQICTPATSTLTATASSPSQQQKSKLSYATHATEYQATQGLFARQLSMSGVLQQAIKTNKQTKVDLMQGAELPTKPKKPVTAWILFVRERKDAILSQKSKMSATELATILAKEWKHIDKAKYEQEYKQMQDEYNKLVENYQNSLTDEHRDLINLQKRIKRETKAAKLLRKTHPPVLPRNPANLYCHERSKQDDFKEMLKYKKVSQVFSDIFKEYRELSDEAKKKYIDMQEEDKARFQHEFLSWYEGIQSNEKLTKVARDQANELRDRLKALTYI